MSEFRCMHCAAPMTPAHTCPGLERARLVVAAFVAALRGGCSAEVTDDDEGDR